MTITISGISFEGPTPLFQWDAPRKSGVYVIMMKGNAQAEPNTYSRVYIGQSGDLEDRGFPRSHHKYPCWKRTAGSDDNLFIAIHPMPGSSEKERTDLEQSLIKARKSPCND